MLRQSFLALFALLSIGLFTACASSPPYSPEPFQAEAIDAKAFVPKVDSFVVILDASSSMLKESEGSIKFHTAKDFVASFNQTVPELDYEAGLVRFGGYKDDSTDTPPAGFVYGLETYQRSGFAAGLDAVDQASNITPMSDGIDAASGALSKVNGPVAVILVSDFWRLVDPASAMAAAERLVSQNENLCLYILKVGDYERVGGLIEKMAALNDCGKAMTVSDLASAGAMASFVKAALLKPAPQEKPVQYEKISLSAMALFDFDKAVLKEEGKVELQKLGQYIKGKGIKVVDINVIGHTDSKGSEEYNQKLSERRAMAVKDYLVIESVDGSIIDASGEGESNPVADNSTNEGRALNRRVEVHVGAKQQLD
jgi:OOP family OmpA-OmpF porin